MNAKLKKLLSVLFALVLLAVALPSAMAAGRGTVTANTLENSATDYHAVYAIAGGGQNPENVKAVRLTSSYDTLVNQFITDNRWKNGVSWGSNKRPLISPYNCYSCAAYTADFAKYVFNHNSYTSTDNTTNVNEIRAGDVLSLLKSNGGHHFIAVLYRNGNSLYTAEGNYSSRVVVANGKYSISGSQIVTSLSQYTLSRAWHHQ